jgi:hypothetical protein
MYPCFSTVAAAAADEPATSQTAFSKINRHTPQATRPGREPTARHPFPFPRHPRCAALPVAQPLHPSPRGLVTAQRAQITQAAGQGRRHSSLDDYLLPRDGGWNFP